MNKIFRLFNSYIRPQWKMLLVALVAAQVSTTQWFTMGYLSKVMVDQVLQIGSAGSAKGRLAAPGDERRWEGERPASQDDRVRSEAGMGGKGPRKHSQVERLNLLKWIFIGYVFIRVFFACLNWFSNYLIVRMGQDLIFHLRKDVYDKLQSLQLSYFDRRQTGKIMARVMDDVGAIQWSISGLFIQFFSNITTLLVGIVIMTSIHVQMSMVAFCTLPFYVLTYRFFLRRVRAVSKLVRERNSEIYGIIGENLNGVRVVKSFARERYETWRFYRKISQFLRLESTNAVYNTFMSTLCGLISGVGTTIVLYMGILAMRDGTMTLGNFLYFSNSVGFLFGPIVSLSDMNIKIQWFMTALTRVFEVLDEEVKIEESENAVDMEEMYGEVIFRHVSLRYEDAPGYALKGLNFAVMPGSLVCIVGQSGAGKSSLVNLLLRLYDPTEGRITIDGEDIRDISLKSLRKHIRMVPQEAMLFSGTLASNIRYGHPEATPSEVIQASEKAELHEFIMSLPAKYETEIGEGGVSLSGGQKQRLSMAMTLITNPSVLILDDSTSALDAKTEGRIQRTIGRISKDRTAFVITQKVAMCRKADLVLVLKGGQLVEQGTYDKLVRKQGTFYDMFRTQIETMEQEAPEGEKEKEEVEEAVGV
ncbi:MAG: ABC transporter ATP-binding protein [Candidatus Latescibacteria bacterium]|nr:ABC transporter ATP-binding protein [Candidatus Latescibacterota bacterium]